MRAVVQRVARASVTVADDTVATIGRGLVVLLGVRTGDDEEAAMRMARKVVALRIFPDARGRLTDDVSAAGGAVLLVSQFTLLADTRRGNRPSFTDAAEPGVARTLFERVGVLIEETGIAVAYGRFGEAMAVELVNDGPVTIVLDVEQVSPLQHG